MPRDKIDGAPKAAPYRPSDYEIPDVVAFQALHRGEADADQQKRVLKYLIETLCGTYDLAYRPASARDTDFALGKAWVGQQAVKLLHLNVKAFTGKPTENP
jgi:hypothetical protein